MITHEQFPLEESQSTFAVANTPLFLLRKLREGDDARVLSRSMSGQQILEALRESVREAPKTLFEAVRPYVCLVALSLQDDARYLRNATLIEPSYEDDWFAYVRQVLVESFQPMSRKTIPVPSLPEQIVTTRTDAATIVTPGTE